MRKNDEEAVTPQPTVVLRGVQVFQGWLDRADQLAMLAQIRDVVQVAPLVQPVTPSGRKMSVQMTSAGKLGWITDRGGYRYETTHPNGTTWPEIPSTVRAVWDAVSGSSRGPDSCLINLYREAAKMGLHQDRNEADFSYPVVSISLGDDGLFRIGNMTRGGTTEKIWLKSGDVVVMGGDARLIFHGIDKTRLGSSTLLSGGGRLNLTMRVVT
ncbi:alpha-ketoglutarate-dependent dioxygenase AlkB [Pseudooctadecabacter sp.]|uniref:alpha-ketoglutarate-dependent dioxygenase AlkB family protein n=1 Tax=Pseudooctadecabacter sp. TaxID=1966338 RepID=UPI0035C79E22